MGFVGLRGVKKGETNRLVAVIALVGTTSPQLQNSTPRTIHSTPSAHIDLFMARPGSKIYTILPAVTNEKFNKDGSPSSLLFCDLETEMLAETENHVGMARRKGEQWIEGARAILGREK